MSGVLAIIGLILFCVGFVGVAGLGIVAAFKAATFLGFMTILVVGLVIGVIAANIEAIQVIVVPERAE